MLLGSISRICAAAGSGVSARPSDAKAAKARLVNVFRIVDPQKSNRAVTAKPALIMTRFGARAMRSEEHTSELQSLMRISYAVFCLKKKTNYKRHTHIHSSDSI